jgi:hypothetical protein
LTGCCSRLVATTERTVKYKQSRIILGSASGVVKHSSKPNLNKRLGKCATPKLEAALGACGCQSESTQMRANLKRVFKEAFSVKIKDSLNIDEIAARINYGCCQGH